jgi:hypothetical protein
MLDTIEIKHFFQSLASDDFKKRWKFLSKQNKRTWILNANGANTLPNLSIFQTENGLWHFTARVSLPKMLFGHNSRLPNQAEAFEGVLKVAEYAEVESGLPFDAMTATVSLVHYAYDIHLLQSQVLPMISKLSDRTMKHLQKLLYDNSTLYFQTKDKSRLVRIYSKFLEVLAQKNAMDKAIQAAKGVLRFEHSFAKSGTINSFVERHSLPDKTALTLLNEDVSMLAILEVFDELNFFELLNNERSDLETLLEHYPLRKAQTLFGFLETVRLYGEKFYKDESLGFSKDCYYKDARNCRKAKLWKRGQIS